MATAESVKAKLQNLIGQANAATGNTDADLTAAVSALIAGFGQGACNADQIGQETPTPSFINLFYALEHGTAVTGTFTLASALPGETMIFSSGLPALNGIMLVNTDRTEALSGQDGVWFSLGLLSDGTLLFGVILKTTAAAAAEIITRGTWRIDGGDLYVTPDFNNNSQYSPFRVGENYRWVAW